MTMIHFVHFQSSSLSHPHHKWINTSVHHLSSRPMASDASMSMCVWSDLSHLRVQTLSQSALVDVVQDAAMSPLDPRRLQTSLCTRSTETHSQTFTQSHRGHCTDRNTPEGPAASFLSRSFFDRVAPEFTAARFFPFDSAVPDLVVLPLIFPTNTPTIH